jgi:flagellar basal body-associated protein FliL
MLGYQEQAMSDQNRPEETSEEKDRREQRMMWIFSGAIVVLILGAMGANMLFHKDSPAAENTDISSQSRAAPAR